MTPAQFSPPPRRPRRVRLPGGALRDLDALLGSSPERCAVNLRVYLARLLKRVGLDRGKVWVQLCRGHVVGLWYQTGAPYPVPGRRSLARPDPEPAGAPAPGAPADRRPAHSPGEIRDMLHVRLGRLLKHFAYRFGTVELEFDGGEIERIRFVLDYRPRLDTAAALGGLLFSEAPPSRAWRLPVAV